MSERAEGSETPPAPESPGQEAAPAADETADDGGSESQRPRLLPVWILLAAAAVAGGAWAVTERVGGGGPPPDEAAVPLVAASAEPWKVRPDDPGGMEIPNQGTLIYETLTTADPEEGPERVLPPPEEPLSPPPKEPAAEEPVAPEDAPIEVVALPEPDAGAPADAEQAPSVESDVPEPAVDAGAPATEPETYVVALDGVPLPPRKPGMAAPVPVAEVPQAEASQADNGALELALTQDSPTPESENPAASPLAEEVDGVPIPVFKPVGVARAAPASPAAPSGDAADSLPESQPEQAQPDTGDWRYVQLGASNARRPLEAHWEMLRRRHDDVLVGLSPLIMPVDSGENGITYRLRAGPLSDWESARWVCAQLRARGLDCFVPAD